MTIIEELKQIANVCITSDEFTQRAKNYLIRKGIRQTMMSDAELRELYHNAKKAEETEKAWAKYKNTIRPMLGKRPDCDGIYYEAWVDLSEAWIDMWFSTLRFMKDDEIVEVCAKYLNEQERFYDSNDYIDMLNKLL
jgi:hypothetical protein